MIKKILINNFSYFLLFWVVPTQLLLSNPFSVTIEPQVGSIDDQFILKISLQGEGPMPKIPKVDGLEILHTGKSSHFQFQMGSGGSQRSQLTTYTYYLGVEAVGEYTIPPIDIKVDNVDYKSEPIKFAVNDANNIISNKGSLPPSTGSSNAPTSSGSNPPNQQTQPSNQAKAGSDVYIEAKVNKPQVYLGEQVILSILVYHRVQLYQFGIMDFKIDGARSYEIKDHNQTYQEINGVRYSVVEKKYVLLTQRVGTLKVPSIILQAYVQDGRSSSQGQRRRGGTLFDDLFNDFDNFFGRRSLVPRNVSTKAMELTVKPLPAPKPADFSGLVGEYALSASLAPIEVKVGDTAYLEITLSGSGKSVGTEEFNPEFPKSFNVYPEPPKNSDSLTSDGWSTKQEFKFAFVPTEAGNFDLGESSIHVFDTKTEKYRLLQAPLGTLKVEGDSAVSNPSSSVVATTTNKNSASQKKSAVDEGAYLSLDQSSFKPITKLNDTHKEHKLLYFIAFLPWFLLLFVIGKKRISSLPPSARQRVSRANEQFRATTKETLASNLNIKDKITQINSAIRNFYQSVWQETATSYTEQEFIKKLHQHYPNSDQTSELISLVSKLSEFNYSTVLPSTNDLQSVTYGIQKILDQGKWV